jgi:hypothetical protein
VLDHFDMGDVPECAVFFDDKDVNGKFSREAEVPFVKVGAVQLLTPVYPELESAWFFNP